jgi:hypothetical protein
MVKRRYTKLPNRVTIEGEVFISNSTSWIAQPTPQPALKLLRVGEWAPGTNHPGEDVD